MQVTIESTPEFTLVNDLPVRIWTGKTGKGTPVLALVVRLAVDKDDDASELVAELLEPPTNVEPPERPIEPDVADAAKPGTPEDIHYRAARHALDVLRRVSQALMVCDGLPKDPGDPFHLAVESIHGILTGSPPLTEPTPAASWLVKDFWALYRAAKATLEIETVDDAVGTRGWLREQIRRLAPAFEVCEQERRGAEPSRLTVAEREALAAVHRWRHSPSGDGALMAGTEAFHIQAEVESPETCEALEAEERAARDETLADRSRTIVDQARKVFATVGVMGFPGSSEPPPPVLSARIIKRIIEDERASGDASDPHEAAEFLAAALRGAQHGWLARRDTEREAWPRRLEETLAQITACGRHGERAREAWRFGFETALETPEPAAETELYPVDPAHTVNVTQLDGTTRVECDHTFAGGRGCAYCGIPFAVLQRRNAAESRALLERLDATPFHVAPEDPPSLMDTRDVVIIDPRDPAPLIEQANRAPVPVPVHEIPASVLERFDAPRVERSSWKPEPLVPLVRPPRGETHALAIEERDRAELVVTAAEAEREHGEASIESDAAPKAASTETGEVPS